MMPERLHPLKRNAYGATIDVVRTPWDEEDLPGIRTERDLLFHVVRGQQSGFFLAINAGTHGDEPTSIEAAYRITDVANKHLQSGTYVCLPQSNPESVRQRVRGSEYDLNRSFDFRDIASISKRGQKHAGAIMQRLAGAYRAYTEHISEGIILDLHTEDLNTAGRVLPYIRMDATKRDDVLEMMIRCSELLGIPYAWEASDSSEYDTSLTGYAVQKLGIPALTIELGPGGTVSEVYARMAEAMIGNFMNYFGMLSVRAVPEEQWFPDENMLDTIRRVKKYGPLQLVDGYCADKDGAKSRATGTLVMNIEPGQIIQKGEPIGTIIDRTTWPSEMTPIFARKNCVVLSVPGSCIVEYQPGDVVYQGAETITDPRMLRIYHTVLEKI